MNVIASLIYVLALVSCVAAKRADPSFVQVNPMADDNTWLARRDAGFHFITHEPNVSSSFRCFDPDTGRLITRVLSSYFILYGGTTNHVESYPLNDVWIAPPNMTYACFIAGYTWDGIGHRLYQDESFLPTSNAASCHYKNTMYRAGGLFTQIPVNDVWTSTNGFRWQQATDEAPWTPRYSASMVVDASGVLWLAGGIGRGIRLQNFNDVWFSSDGRTWKQDAMSVVGRGRAQLVIDSPWNWKLLYLAGEDVEKNVYLNDVWGLDAKGDKFQLITGAAQFPARANAHVSVTQKGALIISGGQGNVTHAPAVFNDVWLSVSTKTWTECLPAAEWSARTSFMSVLDPTGVMWVLGGADAKGNLLNDVWKSTFSFDDPQCKSVDIVESQ